MLPRATLLRLVQVVAAVLLLLQLGWGGGGEAALYHPAASQPQWPPSHCRERVVGLGRQVRVQRAEALVERRIHSCRR